MLQESSEKLTSFWGLWRQWYYFTQEKHRWRQFWFTPNHLFPVTATQKPNWKKNPNLGEAWDLIYCTASLYSAIVLQESSENLLVFAVFKGNYMILLRKSIDGANFYLQETICFLQQQHCYCATEVYLCIYFLDWNDGTFRITIYKGNLVKTVGWASRKN